MRTIRGKFVALSIALLLPLAVSAQSFDDIKEMSPEDRRAYIEGLSDEDRSALREERRAKFDSMSDEERQAMREKRRAGSDERRARWESMSDEERTAARERHTDRKGHRDRRPCGDRGQDQG